MHDLQSILKICETEDAFAAAERIGNSSDPLAAAKLFVEVMRDFYWRQKRLATALLFGQSGVHFSMVGSMRVAASDAALASKLRGVAKGLLYDLASFTWPGWDEPGISICSSDLTLGLEAARANLRLARELNKGDLALSRAHWMLAGHQIGASDLPAARENYVVAAGHAMAAGRKSEELLANGFARMTDLLITGSTAPDTELQAIVDQLSAVEDGPEFVRQIQCAQRVFQTQASG